MWYEIKAHTWNVLERMDNANRRHNHALDVFLENIVGVALWGAFACLVGDTYMLYWRGVMLLINLVDYIRRLRPVINALLDRAFPSSKTRRGTSSGQKINWTI